MVFSSPIFLFCFLPIVFILYRISKNDKYRNVFLAIASLIFYAFGQLEYLWLFLLSVVINYVSGLFLNKKRSKVVLYINIVLNLALLCVFKYSVELGISGLALPIGISFFTFQGMSYVFDTYREPEYGTKDFMKVFLYISFFPRLIAGPIVKYKEIEPQLLHRNTDPDRSADGIRRFILGFSKKMLVSEPMAHAVNEIMSHYSSNGVSDFRLAWLVAICYALQLYYDFSGYSDMAIGIGKMFGFVFPENFDYPYGAFSIKEFWRKWHISLSSWFKEYVYIPLGGNRKGKTRAMLNRLIVFLLTGIWHGANLTYVFWGICHGLLSSFEDMGIVPVKKLEKSKSGKVVLKIYTFLAVVLLFVIFRATSLTQGFQIIGAMFASPAMTANNLLIGKIVTPFFLFILILAITFAGRLPKKIDIHNIKFKSAICIILLILSIFAMAKGNSTPFIYAQF